jgi:hypothetical protein
MNSSDFVKDGWQAGLWRVTSCTASFTGGTAGSVSNGVVTIGANNTAVTVSNAFSAKYEAYKIVITGGVGSTSAYYQIQLGSTVTGYYSSALGTNFSSDTLVVLRDNNAAQWSHCGNYSTVGSTMNVEVHNPFLATRTHFGTFMSFPSTALGAYRGSGYLNDTTSYTSFVVKASSGNFSSGQIRVYGYNN